MTTRIKYPRTPHLPWSPGSTNDDRFIEDTSFFEGQEIVVTEKRDGENTTIYRDGVHARSLDSKRHASRSWVASLQAKIGHRMDEDLRICGENLFAKHSIHYDNLYSYFEVFGVTLGDLVLSWDATVRWCRQFDLATVPVLYQGPWDGQRFLDEMYSSYSKTREMEGYVVRLSGSFPESEFATSVAKYVRKGHVTTSSHWMSEKLVRNSLG